MKWCELVEREQYSMTKKACRAQKDADSADTADELRELQVSEDSQF